jgi:DNA-binding response OmpR family regulator
VKRYREFEKLEDLKNTQLELPPRKLNIIGMSANSDNATKQCALNIGMNSFLGKPFDMKELQRLINQGRISEIELD